MPALPDPYLAPLYMFHDTEYNYSDYFFLFYATESIAIWYTACSFNSHEANEGDCYL